MGASGSLGLWGRDAFQRAQGWGALPHQPVLQHPGLRRAPCVRHQGLQGLEHALAGSPPSSCCIPARASGTKPRPIPAAPDPLQTHGTRRRAGFCPRDTRRCHSPSRSSSKGQSRRETAHTQADRPGAGHRLSGDRGTRNQSDCGRGRRSAGGLGPTLRDPELILTRTSGRAHSADLSGLFSQEPSANQAAHPSTWTEACPRSAGHTPCFESRGWKRREHRLLQST